MTQLLPVDLASLQLPADSRDAVSARLLDLTRAALAAPDLAAGVTPTLQQLVGATAAVGSAYFQLGSDTLSFQVRAAAGDMPQTDGMAAIAAHGLPPETPLMRALHGSDTPLFFDDTRAHPASAGFPELGVASLAAAPVRDHEGALLGAFLMHTFAPHTWQPGEAALFSVVSGTVAALAGRLAAQEQATFARESALRALGLALEARDGETQGHTDRVTALALRFAERLGVSGTELRALRWGAYLHDIGKIAIPDAVLLKPGRFEAHEWALMQTHVFSGVQFAGALRFLPPGALAVIEDHHERWDGGGYPAGKAGTDISLHGRLFALCDVYDALTSARPYKSAWTAEDALAEIARQGGAQFDPELTREFVAMLG